MTNYSKVGGALSQSDFSGGRGAGWRGVYFVQFAKCAAKASWRNTCLNLNPKRVSIRRGPVNRLSPNPRPFDHQPDKSWDLLILPFSHFESLTTCCLESPSRKPPCTRTCEREIPYMPTTVLAGGGCYPRINVTYVRYVRLHRIKGMRGFPFEWQSKPVRAALRALAVKRGAFVAARALDIVILTDDEVDFLLALLLADVP